MARAIKVPVKHFHDWFGNETAVAIMKIMAEQIVNGRPGKITSGSAMCFLNDMVFQDTELTNCTIQLTWKMAADDGGQSIDMFVTDICIYDDVPDEYLDRYNEFKKAGGEIMKLLPKRF